MLWNQQSILLCSRVLRKCRKLVLFVSSLYTLPHLEKKTQSNFLGHIPPFLKKKKLIWFCAIFFLYRANVNFCDNIMQSRTPFFWTRSCGQRKAFFAQIALWQRMVWLIGGRWHRATFSVELFRWPQPICPTPSYLVLKHRERHLILGQRLGRAERVRLQPPHPPVSAGARGGFGFFNRGAQILRLKGNTTFLPAL